MFVLRLVNIRLAPNSAPALTSNSTPPMGTGLGGGGPPGPGKGWAITKTLDANRIRNINPFITSTSIMLHDLLYKDTLFGLNLQDIKTSIKIRNINDSFSSYFSRSHNFSAHVN